MLGFRNEDTTPASLAEEGSAPVFFLLPKKAVAPPENTATENAALEAPRQLSPISISMVSTSRPRFKWELLGDATGACPAAENVQGLLKRRPGFVDRVPVLREGAIGSDGTLAGNLYLRGVGDPSLGPRFWHDQEARLRE